MRLFVRVCPGTAGCGVTPRGCCLLKHFIPARGKLPSAGRGALGRGRQPLQWRGGSQRCPHMGATVERGERGRGLGAEGEVVEAFRAQDGLRSPLLWARGQGAGTPPADSAAESRVLPLHPEQQHSEKPLS